MRLSALAYFLLHLLGRGGQGLDIAAKESWVVVLDRVPQNPNRIGAGDPADNDLLATSRFPFKTGFGERVKDMDAENLRF